MFKTGVAVTITALAAMTLAWQTQDATAQSAAPAPASPPWSYAGTNGPDHWAHLTPNNTACAAREQSPVDIVSPVRATLGPLALIWRPVPVEVERNGHAIEAKAQAAPGTAPVAVTLNGQSYGLLQFHLHQPSEHRIAGRQFPLEVHFVHRNSDGQLTVVGILFEEGRANPGLQQMIDHATADGSDNEATIDPRAFLPARRAYYRYEGSLTTPPCSEVVNWVVMERPVTASTAQIAAVAAIYPGNARPLQPLGRRFILRGQ
jgi:carbonic anhydrase